jgi:hypothetical protein
MSRHGSARRRASVARLGAAVRGRSANGRTGERADMAGTIYLKSSQAQVGEQAGTHLVDIARSGSLAGEVAITWGLTGDGATAGLDFAGGSGSVTMPAASPRSRCR